MPDKNTLYYGDNLDILRRYVRDESVDLVYLDPPFNSAQDYNVLFAERDGAQSAAQIKAFGDTWRWDQTAALAYRQIVETGGRVSQAMQAFHQFLGPTDMLAYLAMMAPRLVELRRVLKETGSIYLHCDPTASHYLKMLMDAVFGAANFLNEITWKRTFSHGSSRRYGPLHDVVLFYSKSQKYEWGNIKTQHDPAYLEKHFRQTDEASGRRFQPISLTGAGIRHGESGKPWRGVNPTDVGRHWALPGAILRSLRIEKNSVPGALDALDSAGRIYWPSKEGGTPRLKWYIEDSTGVALPDVWTDIPPISAQAAERLGYPTQKPEALLERIVQASSNQGDTVLDPFCGCGTAIAVAQRLKRRWIGIDITPLAINLIKARLSDAFGSRMKYDVVGEPTTVEDARKLAKDDPYHFQYWALGLVGARPHEERKGMDRGIDGRLYFHDEAESGPTKQIVLSVKAGHTQPAHVRDLRGVLDREGAAIGVLITMEEPTKQMRSEVAEAGYYRSPKIWAGEQDFSRLQILTVGDLLEGKRIAYPAYKQTNVTFKKAPKAKTNKENAPEADLFEEAPGSDAGH